MYFVRLRPYWYTCLVYAYNILQQTIKCIIILWFKCFYDKTYQLFTMMFGNPSWSDSKRNNNTYTHTRFHVYFLPYRNFSLPHVAWRNHRNLCQSAWQIQENMLCNNYKLDIAGPENDFTIDIKIAIVPTL